MVKEKEMMMSELRSEPEPAPLSSEELEALPIFPLPRLVFFPGSRLPLHLFEPRYLEMMEHCLQRGPEAIAVATLGKDAKFKAQTCPAAPAPRLIPGPTLAPEQPRVLCSAAAAPTPAEPCARRTTPGTAPAANPPAGSVSPRSSAPGWWKSRPPAATVITRATMT